MIESQVRALFNQIADAKPGPSRVDIQLARRGGRETINGYRVVVTHQVRGTLPRQDLCAGNANGLALYISEFGAHPPISLASLFRDHLRLLGANPANWTSKPIG